MKGKLPLIQFTDRGIYCPVGDFYIDPVRKVRRAVITHAHADHAKSGHGAYLCHSVSEPVLKLRLGKKIHVQSLDYGREISMNGVKVSLYPAGHIPGSAQVRIEHGGEVWVVAGDYKTGDDGLSTPYEYLRCHVFVTESTFGLPIFKWQPQEDVFEGMLRWSLQCYQQDKIPVLLAYSLGKAQRLLYYLHGKIDNIYVHPAIEAVNQALRQAGIPIPKCRHIPGKLKQSDFKSSLIIIPPGASSELTLNYPNHFARGVASGWAAARKSFRRYNGASRGFVISDHADWDGLNLAVNNTGAGKIIVSHGFTRVFARWLRERGMNAEALNGSLEFMNG
ncbi:MAG: ligase-associated DNA damage response exonuclease [Bacteroidales bacterium]